MELVGGRRWAQPEHVEAVGTAEHRVGAGETGHRKRASRAAEPEPGVVLNPTKRSRTQLTEAKVDAIRNARTARVSPRPAAGSTSTEWTVWTHTKDLL